MRKPIFLRILAGYILVTVITTVIVLLFAFHSIRDAHIQNAREHLRRLSAAVEYTIVPMLEEGDLQALNKLIGELGECIDARITLIAPDGRVLADSENDPAGMENHATRPEVRQALSGLSGSSLRHSETLGKDMLYMAIPLNAPPGVLRLSLTLEDIETLLEKLQVRIIQVAMGMILLVTLVAMIFSHHISRPVWELHRASTQVASGDFDIHLHPHGNDELSDLAQGFTSMTEQLASSFSEISRRNEELEGIISSMSEALLVLDKDGRIILYNDSALKVISTGDIKGRYYWEVLRSEHIDNLFERARRQSHSEQITLGERVYLLSATPLPLEKAVILLLHDITESVEMDRMKKDLVVNVSHELRTPLTAIKGFTETLLDESDAHTAEYLMIIQRHTDRLINIVNDLLDLSALEESATHRNIEQVDLKELVTKALTVFEQRARAKGLEIKVEAQPDLPPIEADPFVLEQLFTNLIDNAVKYTEHGEILITLKMPMDDLVITVSDTGIGIPKEHIARVFERFYVVDKSRSRRQGGTGLGLAIVKHIVSAHHGDVSLASSLNKGTTFTIELPITQPS
ncbi:MAG: ATP-binding protein [Thermodesulfobacteriota bacterium]|nr:ATP-binding protein [Thermodesulfobacteriota bacterium]